MTPLVSTDIWKNELTTRLPGISSGQLDLELKSTIREFFTKSGYWVEELPAIDIKADKDQYRVNTQGQSVVMGVQQVFVSGTPIGLTTYRPKFQNSGSARASSAYPVEVDLLELSPVPNTDIDGGLIVIARLNPIGEICKVPETAATHFFDEIMDGVLGRLYSQPGKPYTNLIQSQYHLKRFRDGMAMARDIARKRFSTATRPWSFPQGWGTNTGRAGNTRVV